MKLLVCIPTYNEVESIEKIIYAGFKYLDSTTCEKSDILIIDDNSPDGTAGIVEKLIEVFKDRLHILNRTKKEGLAGAYLAGFDWGLSRGYDIFLEMDADFSHDPKYISG